MVLDRLDDQAGTLEFDGDDWSFLQTGNQAVRDGTLSMFTGIGNVSIQFFGEWPATEVLLLD